MKISCLQMQVQLAQPEQNLAHAEELIRRAMTERPDVLVLPETWNTGFFPREGLAALSDQDGALVRRELGALAEKYGVHLVAGSVSNRRGNRVYNTALVFDRTGRCVAEYDKTHLFSPMGENAYYTPGERLCRFELDGVPCGLIICYDLRFPELSRRLALEGAELLFVVSQWPAARVSHLRSLIDARAIENQMFVVCCNACGQAGETVYGGHSSMVDPWGRLLAEAGPEEEILTARCERSAVAEARAAIPVFRDRRPSLYAAP